MKWYWIVLIVIGILALGYLVWMNMPKKTSTKVTTTTTGGGAGPTDGGGSLPS